MKIVRGIEKMGLCNNTPKQVDKREKKHSKDVQKLEQQQQKN